METLSKEHVRRVVNTLWTQLITTTSPDVIGSWGVSGLWATQIVKNINGYDLAMAALMMSVEGFSFQGQVYVALDEGSDYYRIYIKDGEELKEQHIDVAFEELGQILDSVIETGGMSEEQYQERIVQKYNVRVV